MQTDTIAYIAAFLAFVGYLLVQEPQTALERNYLDDAKYLADHRPLSE